MILKKLREKSISNIFWWVIFLCFFNISADVKMSVSKTVPLNILFNEQESIVELIFEKILCFKDAIPEGEDSETEDYHTGSHSAVDLFIPGYSTVKAIAETEISVQKLPVPYRQNKFQESCFPNHTPPPEA